MTYPSTTIQAFAARIAQRMLAVPRDSNRTDWIASVCATAHEYHIDDATAGHIAEGVRAGILALAKQEQVS